MMVNEGKNLSLTWEVNRVLGIWVAREILEKSSRDP